MGLMRKWCVTLIATALGSGLSPKAPGTAGSVVAVALVFLTQDWSATMKILLWLILFFSGWWATLEWSRVHRNKDSSSVVIDEVLGYIIAMGTLPVTPLNLWTQFALFRLFDILKPPPIRQLDRWGKKHPIGPLQSLGVILDDLMAGILALGCHFALKTALISMGIYHE